MYSSTHISTTSSYIYYFTDHFQTLSVTGNNAHHWYLSLIILHHSEDRKNDDIRTTYFRNACN